MTSPRTSSSQYFTLIIKNTIGYYPTQTLYSHDDSSLMQSKTSPATHKIPLKPALSSLILLSRAALAVLLFQVNGKSGIITQMMQDLQLASLALHQRPQLGLVPDAMG